MLNWGYEFGRWDARCSRRWGSWWNFREGLFRRNTFKDEEAYISKGRSFRVNDGVRGALSEDLGRIGAGILGEYTGVVGVHNYRP